MTKEVDFWHAKETLFDFYYQAVYLQLIKKQFKVFKVLFFRFAGNQYVIQIYEYKIQPGAHRVHEALECSGCIFKSHWHPQELEKAERRDDGCFGDIIWMDRNLVISFHKIHLRKNYFPRQV